MGRGRVTTLVLLAVAFSSPAASHCGGELCIGSVTSLGLSAHIPTTQLFAETAAPRLSYDLSLSLVSDYVSNGISYTSGRAALQGSADINYAATSDIALSLGVWTSNVYIPATRATKEEIDTSISAARTIPKGSLALSFTHYSFPGVARSLGLEGFEIEALADRQLTQPLALYGSVAYTEAFADKNVTGAFAKIGFRHEAGAGAWDFGFDTHIGRQWYDDIRTFAISDYYEYGLTVFRRWHGLEVAIGVTSSDLTRAECFGGATVCGRRVIASLTRAFSW